MTALVQGEVDGDRLTHAEIAAFFAVKEMVRWATPSPAKTGSVRGRRYSP